MQPTKPTIQRWSRVGRIRIQVGPIITGVRLLKHYDCALCCSNRAIPNQFSISCHWVWFCFVFKDPSKSLLLTVYLILLVSCAKDADSHHLRCHKLSERKCDIQGHPFSSHWDQDHHIRVTTGERNSGNCTQNKTLNAVICPNCLMLYALQC